MIQISREMMTSYFRQWYARLSTHFSSSWYAQHISLKEFIKDVKGDEKEIPAIYQPPFQDTFSGGLKTFFFQWVKLILISQNQIPDSFEDYNVAMSLEWRGVVTDNSSNYRSNQWNVIWTR